MHSTGTGPSHSKWSSGLPGMRWRWPRLRRLWRVRVLLVPVLLLPDGDQREQPEQWRRVRQQRKAEVVATRFVRGVYSRPGAGAHAGPQQYRKSSEAA